MTPKLKLKTETVRSLTDEMLSVIRGGNHGKVSSDSPSVCIGCGPRNSCNLFCPTFPDPKPFTTPLGGGQGD